MIYLVPLFAVLSAWSGGSLWPSQYLPKWATWTPEALFALLAGVMWSVSVSWWGLPFVTLWVYGWMQAATANGLHWGNGQYEPDRDTSFSPLVHLITDALNIDRSSTWYCRIYFGVKGFLMSLPFGGVGAILWPLGYELGNRLKNHTVSELASGLGFGISVSLFLYVTG